MNADVCRLFIDDVILPSVLCVLFLGEKTPQPNQKICSWRLPFTVGVGATVAFLAWVVTPPELDPELLNAKAGNIGLAHPQDLSKAVSSRHRPKPLKSSI